MIWPFKKLRFATRSPKWSKVRSEYLKNNPNCAVCGSNIKPEVHHVIPVHIDSSKELDKDNLITLCDKYCHFIFGHFMNWKSYNINIRDDACLYSQKIKGRP